MCKHKIILSILVLQVIFSCSKSINTSGLQQALPDNYRGTSTDSVSIGDIPWKTFFPDQKLNALIDEAIVNNNDLKVALKNIERAQLTFKQSKLGNIPALDIVAGGSSTRLSDNSLNGFTTNKFLGAHHIDDYNVAARLSWEADIWGKISSRKSSALAQYLQTEEARKAVQTQIVSSVAKAYYNLLMLDTQLRIAKENATLNNNTFSMITLQFESGKATSLAVQQAKAQELEALQLVPRFEQEIIIQENAISILTGKLPEAVQRTSDLDHLTITENISAGIPSSLLARRPDLKRAELDIVRANAEIGFAKANMYPSLIITAQGGANTFKFSNWFNIPASLFGTLAGGLTQPIFQRKTLKTQYEIAKVSRAQSVVEFRQAVLVAVGEVSNALISIEKLNSQTEKYSERSLTLRQATDNAQSLFQNGFADYLEVITAQGKVLQSELELASIKKEKLDAMVDLYRSVGGGWQ
ncbi:RND transporter [Dyadobacter frigoris]|uniref:TolC family protein n=1 Tax=Dyadobacter frigoris TaxID=2576211 RepID=UPI00249F9FFA|nr:TolC family protein [Dyadobacter frigoris]GLU55235.1 RND transporter [Dyadobacter frigoris]